MTIIIKQPKSTITRTKPTPRVRKKKYLNNADLLIQIALSREKANTIDKNGTLIDKNGKMTDILAHMLMTLCAKYAMQGKYRNYSFCNDMQSFAMLTLVKNWHKFNIEYGENPFAFYTQCVKRSFKQFLNTEKKQRDVRDAMLIRNGMNPSHSYQLEHSSSHNTNNSSFVKYD